MFLDDCSTEELCRYYRSIELKIQHYSSEIQHQLLYKDEVKLILKERGVKVAGLDDAMQRLKNDTVD